MDGTKELPEKGVTIHGQKVWNLRFADDIDLIDKSPAGIQEMINKISEDSKRYGMRINTDKTKTMVNCRSMIENDMKIVLNGKALENVDSSIYLGSLVTWNNDCSADVARRIQLASAAFSNLSTVWKDKGITLQVKIQLLQACVMTVLLYAAETWTLKKQDESKLLAFEMRCYRRLMNIKWQDMRRNEDIRKEIGREVTVVDITKHRKLQLFGHICRMDDTRLLKTLTFGIVEGTRPPGRPPRRWTDDITEWTSMGLEQALRSAQDRDKWRTMTSPYGCKTTGVN